MMNHNGLSTLARKMLSDMDRRFEFVQAPTSSQFDPLYITSTFLALPYRGLLDESQTSVAKTYILQLMKKYHVDQRTETTDIEVEEQGSGEVTEPPVKRFKHLSRVSVLLENQRKDKDVSQVSITEEELEIENYMQYQPTTENLTIDPLQYWVDKRNQYPKLALIACDILATPASTAPVERVFSSAGETSKGKRNRISQKNLEREIFLRRNKVYI